MNSSTALVLDPVKLTHSAAHTSLVLDPVKLTHSAAHTSLVLDPVKLAKAIAEQEAIKALYARHGLFGYGK